MITRIFVLNAATSTVADFNDNYESLEIIGIDKDGMTSVSKETFDVFNAPEGFYELISKHSLDTLATLLLPLFPDAFIYTISDKKKWAQVLPSTTPAVSPYTLQTLSLGFNEGYKIGFEMCKVTAFYSDLKGAFLPPETWVTEVLKYIKEIRGNPSIPKTYTYTPDQVPQWMIEALLSGSAK